MKSISILFLTGLIAMLISCAGGNDSSMVKAKPDNYIILLDLSDRILTNPDQAKIDSTAIQTVFNAFERSVTQHLVLTSKDRFLIRLFKQNQSKYNAHDYEDLLSMDMNLIPVQDKGMRLDSFKFTLGANIQKLYQIAQLGDNTKSFPGVDIWQYFKQQVNSDLKDSANNYVLVLTDGHFDFENKSYGITDTSGYTITGPILNQINQLNWEQQLELRPNLSILPVKLHTSACWMVCGISAKPASADLQEANKLAHIWKKWLTQSGASCVEDPIIYCNSEKTKAEIEKWTKKKKD
jgi:hypothetical protein